MRNKINVVAQVIFLILLDQITKAIFAARDFFIGFMHFHPVKNFGLSFGLNLGLINSFIIGGAALVFLVYFLKHKLNLGGLFIIAGAVSNILDRLRLGYVRDFWDIGLNFTFNLADVFIIIGLLLLVQTNDHRSGLGKQLVE